MPQQELFKCPDRWLPSALEYFAPDSSEPFVPEGPWEHSYYVLNIDESGYARKIPSRQGVLRIARGPTAKGKFSLDIDILTAKHQWKGLHQTNIQAECRANTLASPISWKLQSVILDSSRTPFELTRVRQSGSCARGVVTITGCGSRKVRIPQNVCSNYGLFDVTQRLDYNNFDGFSFSMLEDMDLVKPDQHLYRLDPVEVQAPSGTMKLHGFLQIGRGILPYHYWVDDTGRLILASGGLRAFIFNPDADMRNCDIRWASQEVTTK